MNVDQLKSASLWLDQSRPRFAQIQQAEHYDVLVIGAGITGLTAAYLLKKAGKKVGLFEKSRLGDAETGHTTAHLTYVTDAKLSDLAHQYGKEAAHLVWHGGKVAIDTIEQICREENIECGFQRVPGFFHAAINGTRDETSALQKEADIAAELGFEAKFLEHVPIQERPGVRYADQALFDPIAYLSGIARAFHGDGCEIHEHSEMTEAQEDPLAVMIRGKQITCDRLIIATHVPLTGLSGLVSAIGLQSKLASYSTFAVGAEIPKGALPCGSYNDTAFPYHYLRIHNRRDSDYAILGGEDYKTGQHDDAEVRYERLADLLRELIPDAKIDHRWSGQVVETNDHLPFIGPSTEQQFVATGFAGNGMTFGTLSGMMACDWVMQRENPWSELFSIDRIKFRGGTWNYVRENMDYPYHLVRGFLRTVTGDSLEDVKPGEGKVLKLNGHRRAVYRNPDGEISNCSAICTHLGCVVRWNGAEQTWDCPCHGSRFNTSGKVIAGPAEKPLETEN